VVISSCVFGVHLLEERGHHFTVLCVCLSTDDGWNDTPCAERGLHLPVSWHVRAYKAIEESRGCIGSYLTLCEDDKECNTSKSHIYLEVVENKTLSPPPFLFFFSLGHISFVVEHKTLCLLLLLGPPYLKGMTGTLQEVASTCLPRRWVLIEIIVRQWPALDKLNSA